MPTLLDELLILTKVDLTGLTAGLREAEVAATRARAKLSEALTIPTTGSGSASASIRAFSNELREAEAIQSRISRQFTGGAIPTGSLSILQHQRAVNAEMKEQEAIQTRIARQFAGTALPAAASSILQHQRAVNAEMKEAEAIQNRISRQFVTTPLPVGSSSLAQHQKELEAIRKEQELAAGASVRYAQSWITQGQALQGLGMSLTMGVTAPLALIGVTSAHAALGFDALISKMATLGGVSPQMAQSWREPILAMAAATGSKPNDLAEAAYRIASSGMSDKSQVPTVLQTVAQGSAIGMGSVTDIAETVTSAMNAYTSFGLNAATATGQLIEAMTRGKGEARDFTPIMGSLGLTAEHAGISFAQMAASVAALTRLGAPAAEAGTMVARLVDEFVAPKPHSLKMAQELGIPFETIQKTLRQPQGILDVLQLIGSRTGGQALIERELFPRMEGFRASIGLSGSHMAEARETFAAVQAAGPQTVADTFGLRQQFPSFKMDQATAEFIAAMTRLGTEILPIVTNEAKFLAGAVGGITKGFAGLPDSVKGSTLVLLELAAAAGPLAFLFGGIGKLIGQILLLRKAILDIPGLPAWMLANPLTTGVALGLGVGTVVNNLIAKAQHNSLMYDLTTPGAQQRGALGGMFGAFAGLNAPPELSNLRAGSSFSLRSGVGYAPSPVPGGGLNLPNSRERAAAERLAKERENTQVEADKAEFAFQKKIAGITGDTDLFRKAGEGEIDSEEARAVRRAGGDQQSVADIHRRFAQQRIELGLEETNAFLFAEQKKEQAADKTAQFSLRAIQVQSRAETGLLDVQLDATRRQIQTDEQRGAPLSRILSLYQQESDLIIRKATAEQRAATSSMPILQEQLRLNQERIDHMTAERDTLQGQNVTGDAALARDANVYKINQDLTVEQGRQLEIKEKIDALGEKRAQIQEKELSDLQRIGQERRRTNPTFGEAIQDRLAQDQSGNNREFADIAVDGIHRVGSAMIQMLEGSKAGWRSLGQAAIDIVHRIEDALVNRAINEGVKAIWRKLFPPEEKPQPGPAPGGGKSPLAEVGGLASLWYGANGQDPLARGLGSLFAGGGLGGLMSWFGAGSMPGLSLAAPEAFDASAVAWTMLHSGGIVGHHMGVLSPDEHYAKLQSGEMVLSRGDTSNLFSGGSARVPGGYRPDSRIFMANVARGSGGGTGAVGGGGHQFVTINVHAKDANSFIDSAGEVQRQAATAMHRAHRRSN